MSVLVIIVDDDTEKLTVYQPEQLHDNTARVKLAILIHTKTVLTHH